MPLLLANAPPVKFCLLFLIQDAVPLSKVDHREVFLSWNQLHCTPNSTQKSARILKNSKRLATTDAKRGLGCDINLLVMRSTKKILISG